MRTRSSSWCRWRAARRWWPDASGKNALEWNVILQGKNETVFFDF